MYSFILNEFCFMIYHRNRFVICVFIFTTLYCMYQDDACKFPVYICPHMPILFHVLIRTLEKSSVDWKLQDTLKLFKIENIRAMQTNSESCTLNKDHKVLNIHDITSKPTVLSLGGSIDQDVFFQSHENKLCKRPGHVLHNDVACVLCISCARNINKCKNKACFIYFDRVTSHHELIKVQKS